MYVVGRHREGVRLVVVELFVLERYRLTAPCGLQYLVAQGDGTVAVGRLDTLVEADGDLTCGTHILCAVGRDGADELGCLLILFHDSLAEDVDITNLTL